MRALIFFFRNKEMCEGRNCSEIVRLLAVAQKCAQNLKDKYREEEIRTYSYFNHINIHVHFSDLC